MAKKNIQRFSPAPRGRGPAAGPKPPAHRLGAEVVRGEGETTDLAAPGVKHGEAPYVQSIGGVGIREPYIEALKEAEAGLEFALSFAGCACTDGFKCSPHGALEVVRSILRRSTPGKMP